MSEIDNVHLQLMKTELQLQHFLSGQTFKSEADWEMISIFAKKHKCFLTLSPEYSESGLDISAFTSWFNDGFGSGDVARLDGVIVILGQCLIDKVNVVAKETPDGFKTVKMNVDTSSLSKLPQAQSKEVYKTLSEQGLQFDRNRQIIIDKYKPSINECVEFYSNGVRGLGVIREFRPADNYVELYCYYIYNTGQIGYSMHEKGICTVHEFDFQPMTISSKRRMNRELRKRGKVWYDKLHRIEPEQVKVPKGETYYYINDKMKVVTEKEKDTPTSQFRYIAGNYFKNHEEAQMFAGRFAEMLRDRLAKSEIKSEEKIEKK